MRTVGALWVVCNDGQVCKQPLQVQVARACTQDLHGMLAVLNQGCTHRVHECTPQLLPPLTSKHDGKTTWQACSVTCRGVHPSFSTSSHKQANQYHHSHPLPAVLCAKRSAAQRLQRWTAAA
jgi:hypothetical protein